MSHYWRHFSQSGCMNSILEVFNFDVDIELSIDDAFGIMVTFMIRTGNTNRQYSLIRASNALFVTAYFCCFVFQFIEQLYYRSSNLPDIIEVLKPGRSKNNIFHHSF